MKIEKSCLMDSQEEEKTYMMKRTSKYRTIQRQNFKPKNLNYVDIEFCYLLARLLNLIKQYIKSSFGGKNEQQGTR